MSVSVAVGLAEDPDTKRAVTLAAEQARAGLEGDCDLAMIFAGPQHLEGAADVAGIVGDRLEPAASIGCGAGGVLADGREIERGGGIAIWALAAPQARVATHHFEAEPADGGIRLSGVPDAAGLGEALICLADPYTFSAEALLTHLNSERPGMPVLGGLSSAAAGGSAVMFCDGEVLRSGAVACSLSGLSMIPCVSQGARPVGPEMTVTATDGTRIAELASQPAIVRLREAIAELPAAEQMLAAQGVMLGVVIDENQPEYERGDFLVRPIIAADPDSGALAIGELVGIGQTVRMHVRDGASADEDLRQGLRAQADALGSERAAGALMFTCNGRGAQMFDVPDHDATALEDAFGAPAAGFFCAGEIGPVGGRNFLHGFTATIALFPRGE
jgi:small ligand-binding sensory domain FIST